jgi:DNA end-binding protein Ku
MKAYWQGTLSCDLLTIPVKLYAATTRQEPRFHYLHAQCRTPLEYIRQCPHCGIAVSGEDVVRGYEYEDSLVIVSEQELATLPRLQEEHVIVLRQCVHAHAVDPISFDRAFYVEPAAGAKKAYALLLAVFREAGVVALGTATLREHERLIVLRPAQEALVLHTLFAPTEMLSPARLALPHRPPHPAELRAAQEWVARLSGVYVPEQWVDRTQEALSALVARKAKASANRVPALPGRARRKASSPLPKAAA